jgi:tRNA threonylcarbamoyladenosine biosynthesis protein TsaB
MRVLALDTTTRAGSVALVEDGCVVAEEAGDARRSHAERLPADLLNLLRARSLTPADVDLLAVAAGPGSFTGLRIGIATMQGLAFVHRRQIVPVSLLETLGQVAGRDVPAGTIVAAWVDAHRHEVFSALYRVTGAAPYSPDRLVEIDAPAVGDPETILSRWHREALEAKSIHAFAGDGAVLYADRLGPDQRIVAPPALASTVGLMAGFRTREALDPGAVQPLYLRRPDAEIEREQRKLSTTE